MSPLLAFWNWIPSAWAVIRDFFGHAFAWVGSVIGEVHRFWWGVMLFVAGIVGTVISFTAWAINQMVELADSVDLSDIETGSVTLLQFGAFINRFVPLTESFALAIIIFDIWALVTAFRWVKSFVPTLSN